MKVWRYIFDVIYGYILFADFLDKAIPLILGSKKENISIVEELIEENKGWNYVLFYLFIFFVGIYCIAYYNVYCENQRL